MLGSNLTLHKADVENVLKNTAVFYLLPSKDISLFITNDTSVSKLFFFVNKRRGEKAAFLYRHVVLDILKASLRTFLRKWCHSLPQN